VRVPFEGRTRALVLAAAQVPHAQATTHHVAARREVADSGAGAAQPPFTMELIEP
jgi:hypothetical protein